jgi:23S rRNA U2552 (ribose-2'-O)-methylase RlmE/FtsJ
MGEWFDKLVADCKKLRWGKAVKIYKPNASRKASKEVYIVKR